MRHSRERQAEQRVSRKQTQECQQEEMDSSNAQEMRECRETIGNVSGKLLTHGFWRCTKKVPAHGEPDCSLWIDWAGAQWCQPQLQPHQVAHTGQQLQQLLTRACRNCRLRRSCMHNGMAQMGLLQRSNYPPGGRPWAGASLAAGRLEGRRRPWGCYALC